MYKVGDLVRVAFSNSHYRKGEVFSVKKEWGERTSGLYVVSKYGEMETLYISSGKVEPVTHLTTKEFIKLVEDMGYGVEKWNGKMIIYFASRTVGYVNPKEINKINTNFDEEVKNDLLKVITIYANTPLQLREEKEKLYTLELPNNKHRNRFYCHQVSSGNYSFGKLNPDVNRQPDHIKHFTQKEIDELPNQELIKTLIKKEVKDNE